jgi:hypothetical protein
MCSLEQDRPDAPAARGTAGPAIPAPLTWYARMAPDGSGVQLCRVLTGYGAVAVETFSLEPLAAVNLGHALINLGVEAHQAKMRALDASVMGGAHGGR